LSIPSPKTRLGGRFGIGPTSAEGRRSAPGLFMGTAFRERSRHTATRIAESVGPDPTGGCLLVPALGTSWPKTCIPGG